MDGSGIDRFGWFRSIAGLASNARRPAARRTAWVVVDQAISSLTNFAVAIIVARSVSSVAFGAFAISFLVYALVVSLTRGLVAEPLAIRVSARADQRSEIASAAGTAVACGAVAGLAVLPVAIYLGGAVGGALAVIAAAFPALVLQDTWRMAMFTMGCPARAAVNDLVWGLVQTVLIVGVLLTTSGPVVLLTAAWAGGAVVASGLGVWQAGVVPAVGQTVAYLRRHFAIGWRFASEALLRGGSTYLTMLLVGGIVGTTGVGAIRGGQTLFGPFTVAVIGLLSGGIAEGSRLLARSPHRVLPTLYSATGALLTVSVVWSAALLTMPDSWGRALLGDTWAEAARVILPFAVATAGVAATSGGMLGLRIVAAASETFRLRALTGGLVVVAGVSGAWLWGASGGVWGMATGKWVTAVGAWWLLTRHRRQHPIAFARPPVRVPGGSPAPQPSAMPSERGLV